MPRFAKEYNEGGHPTYNYGSTIEGVGQNLGVFGDATNKYKHKLLCVPMVNYSVISKTSEYIYYIGSDGATDINTDKNILLAFNDAKKGETSLAKSYCESLVKYGNIEAKKHNWKFGDGFGIWDDQSAWIIVANCGHSISYKKYSHSKNVNKFKRKKNARKNRRKYRKKF